jgi:23S rRNA pseudouridine1911/1915/1917 synthase
VTEIGRWSVAPEEARVRLDQYLAHRLPQESRSRIQSWIRGGFALVNGTRAKTGRSLKPGDEIVLMCPPRTPEVLQPEDIPLNIIYEDADVLVVDKPAGLVCHSGAGVRSGTLVNALLHHLGPISAGDPTRPGIVHRLDKGTSGLLIVAKHPTSHRELSQQFKRREVHKEYVALVYGCPDPPTGTLDSPLGRDPKDRKKISVRARRTRSAITHYEVRERLGPLCLLRVIIETGRTHQIRVHLAQAGHPVVGDILYGGNRAKNLPPQLARKVAAMGRSFLHAAVLKLRHPRTGANLTFAAPLPGELQSLLHEL